MQDGFTYAYTPQIMMAWVTDSPHWLNNKRTTSLAYRMLSSMQGSLGIGANLDHWTAEDFATAKRLIAAYHSVQKTIVRGDLYRLITPRDASQFSATQTVSPGKNQSVVFAFANATQEGRGFPLLQLQGLDPAPNTSSRGSKAKPSPALPKSPLAPGGCTTASSSISAAIFNPPPSTSTASPSRHRLLIALNYHIVVLSQCGVH